MARRSRKHRETVSHPVEKGGIPALHGRFNDLLAMASLFVALLALGVSALTAYFQFFFVERSLTGVLLSVGALDRRIALINDGSVEEIVTGINAVFLPSTAPSSVAFISFSCVGVAPAPTSFPIHIPAGQTIVGNFECGMEHFNHADYVEYLQINGMFGDKEPLQYSGRLLYGPLDATTTFQVLYKGVERGSSGGHFRVWFHQDGAAADFPKDLEGPVALRLIP